jgi:hypothetical protein
MFTFSFQSGEFSPGLGVESLFGVPEPVFVCPGFDSPLAESIPWLLKRLHIRALAFNEPRNRFRQLGMNPGHIQIRALDSYFTRFRGFVKVDVSC